MRRTGTIGGILVAAAVTAGAAQTPVAISTQGPPLGPLTLTPGILACTDLPTSTSPITDLRVVGLQHGDRRINAARGDLVVLNGGTPQGLVIGQQYFTRRLMKPINHEPMSAANPAAVATSGWLTVVAADARFAIARIDESCLAVEAGDYLTPYAAPVLPDTVAEAGRIDFSDLGLVLFGTHRRTTFGAGDLLSIDRGQSRGLTAGARVAFYRDRHNGTPLVEIGEGIVVELSAETAKVVLERAAMDVHSGDRYGVRGKP